MEKELERFKNNIWQTRKARINASERLLKNANFIKFLNIYYSCFLIVINILDITSDRLDLGVVSLSLSIILAISLVYLDSQRYLERAEQLKANYIELQRMHNIVDDANYKEMELKFADIMEKTENHTEYDFYKVQIDTACSPILPRKYILYYLRIFWINLLKVLLIAAPILVISEIVLK